jgi:hypothetical protein
VRLSPAHNSFAHTSSAITRGFGAQHGGDASRGGQRPLRVEPARQPLPFLTVAEERAQRGDLPSLAGRGQRLTQPVPEPGGALDELTDKHTVQRGDPPRAGLPRPGGRIGCLGVLGGQPATDLEQVGPDAAADAPGEGGGVVPPVGPLLPELGAAGGSGRMPAGPARRRGAVPELRHRPLHGMHGVQPGAAEQPLLPDPVEQVGGHVLQVWAAVGQHELREGQRQQGVVVAAKLVSPAGQHLPEPGEFGVDPVASEDPPAQAQPLEAAEPVELAEPAQQERV